MSNLTAVFNQSIAVNIVSKFAENKVKVGSEILHRLLSLYKIQLNLSVKEALIKWNIKTVVLPSASSTFKHNPRNHQPRHTNFNNDSKGMNHNINYNGNGNHNANTSLNSEMKYYPQRKRTKSSNKSTSHSHIDNFMQRLEDFKEIKTKRKDRLVKHTEDANKAIYTFSPNISLTHSGMISEGNNSAYLRLYEDSNRRKVDYNKRVNSLVQEMKTKSNQNKPPRCNIDKGKIERLYNDYKVRQKKRITLINQIDNENGITFKPDISSSPLYNKIINTTMHERNKQTIENKNNFIAMYSFIHDMEIKQPLSGEGRKRGAKK